MDQMPKCTICGEVSEIGKRVTYHFNDKASSWTSFYCCYWNKEFNRYQITHRGIIAKTRTMADGNILGVSIENVGH
jgi:hypothetical protein